ncbi:putative glycosyl hydrolase [Rosellinia necatrix]|uniref:Putative glycosyl hydrolase n=1 Tax=Rosellinia necatrix TaxID=77044 RepID=A0A1S7UIA0_ROSNE|nr:putative glycosyl hydrolase [Rosellinia necatrix]
MVSSSFVGGLAARAVFYISVHDIFHAAKTYDSNAVTGINTLQSWYNQGTGLWDTTGWWNSANCLTVLADYAVHNPGSGATLNIAGIIQNTYQQAQKTSFQAIKAFGPSGLPISTYIRMPSKSSISERGFDNFLNDYYDDEGWWALALIRSYDVTGNQEYLQAAMDIFEDMKGGASTCGGIYWSKIGTYTNAIANELYLQTGASLANRVPSKKNYYLDIAKAQWTWFKSSGMINGDNLVNDGLNEQCKNNGMKTWTYNQGVILGGLVELSKATGDKSYLTSASSIATAAIVALSRDGILYEGCEPDCGADGAQFKGIFMRNLRALQQAAPQDAFRNFLLKNADAIWANDRNSNNQLGPTWNGPFATASAGTHSSALDAIVAAVAVA